MKESWLRWLVVLRHDIMDVSVGDQPTVFPLSVRNFSMDWYGSLYEGRESFDHVDEERAYRERQQALTDVEAKDIYKLLGLRSTSSVLDAYCGNGRHAIALAKRGLRVTGVDISRSRISFASRWASDEGVSVRFVVCDIRSLCLACSFDAALVLGGSFTHCLGDDENVALLAGLSRILRPGGILLIDNPNPLRFWRVKHSHSTPIEPGAVPYFDLPLGKGQMRGHVRYHGVDKINELFQRAGIPTTEVFGNREGRGFIPDSPRMVILGRTRCTK